MGTQPLDHRNDISPLSVNETVLAVLPFLAFGVASLASKIIIFNNGSNLLPFWQTALRNPFLFFDGLVLVGLGAGLLKGFPRWVYSYLGWALLFAWWWTGMGAYGYHWQGQVWLPLAGVFLIALAIKRSWLPLKNLLLGFWRDWTLLSLGIYILYSFAFMIYDENHHPYLLLFIAASTLAICLGVWGYYRLAGPLGRVLALLGGLLAATALNMLNEATWDYRAYFNLPATPQKVNLVGLIFFSALAVLMLGNALLARWQLGRQSRLRKA